MCFEFQPLGTCGFQKKKERNKKPERQVGIISTYRKNEQLGYNHSKKLEQCVMRFRFILLWCFCMSEPREKVYHCREWRSIYIFLWGSQVLFHKGKIKKDADLRARRWIKISLCVCIALKCLEKKLMPFWLSMREDTEGEIDAICFWTEW